MGRHWKAFTSILCLGALGGCGTYTPDIQEFWANPGSVQLKVNAIASQVGCELGQAVRNLVLDDIRTARQSYPPRKRRLAWLDSWAAQATLTFTINEKSELNPGISLKKVLEPATTNFPTTTVTTQQSFSLGLGGKLSTAATRTSKVTLFYKLADLVRRQNVPRTCLPRNVDGVLFVQSDLKLRDWLRAAVFSNFTEINEFSSKPIQGVQNVISDQIKFQIVTNGNVTPTWTLVRFSGNTSTPLFGATRDRTQDLLITLGPAQADSKGGVSLATAAQNSHLAQEIGASVSTAIRNLQQQ